MTTGPWSHIRSVVDFGSGVAIIVLACIFVWRAVVWPFVVSTSSTATTGIDGSTPPGRVPTESVSLDKLLARGNPAARVVILEYADLQCPACARFATETLRALVANYIDTGRVRFGFRHFPLPSHSMARSSAVAAQCAAEQGQFWPFLDKVFENAAALDDNVLETAAQSLALDSTAWARCRENPATAAAVQADFDQARKLKLRGTPAFVVGRLDTDGELRPTAVFYGAKSLATFDAAIAQAEKMTPTAK